MADNLNRQSELIDLVNNLETNFKKDGADRKTPQYLMKRLMNLECLWQEFESNHSKILESGLCEGEYFDKSIYNKLKERYVNLKNQLLSCKGVQSNEETKTLPSLTAGVQGLEVNTKINELLNEQRTNIKAFERQIYNLDISKISEKWQLEDELTTINRRWGKIDKIYWTLDTMLDDASGYENDYERLELAYKNIKEKINRKIMNNLHQEKSAPKIELPFFNGNYENWITFKDLFMESIHQNSFISNAQKMQHLKSKLRGEAERLVQHLYISAENYQTCWDTLTYRYDNKRMLFTHYANALLNLPVLQHPNAAQIKRLHDTTMECVNGINNLNINTDTWGPLLVHILVQKLDQQNIEAYTESLKAPKEVPCLEEFLNFLENKFTALEASQKPGRPTNTTFRAPSSTYNNYNKKSYIPPRDKHFQPMEKKTFLTTTWSCPKCNKDHGLYHCKEFLDMTPEERLTTVNTLNICQNCLFSHNGNDCTSVSKCKYCKKNHSTLIHQALTNSNNNIATKQGHRLSSSHVSTDLNEVLLATIQLKVMSSDGTYVNLRALLDQGSQLTLITERATQHLKMKRNKYDAVVTGLGAVPSNRCKGEVQLTCQSTHNNFTFNATALVMNTLTNKLPNSQFNTDQWSHLEHLKLADPQFNIPGEIDILLGADVYAEIIMEGLIRGSNTNIIAQQTQLGWVVCGKFKTFNCHVVLNNVDQLTKFWEQEDICEGQTKINSNDICEQHYIETTTRLPDGRYQVRLPMKPGFENQLGESKPKAVAIFKQLQRKMNKHNNYATDYKAFIDEYKNLGHMKVSLNKQELGFYLPHHGVIRSESVTTKLRVVFNASEKTTTGLSLNDLMEAGPNLQADLQTLLLQWREYRYVGTADIEKMYRYIAIHPEDQKLQKIIWSNDPTLISSNQHQRFRQPNFTEYELCTVTYGTKAAPYLAQRTLKQLAQDEGDRFPLAKPILQNNFYMDDVMFSKETIEEVRATRDELIQLLRAGGLNLRKRSSNHEEIVQDLPMDMRNPKNYNFTESETSKTLGLGWNPKSDEFIYTSPLEQTNIRAKYTKRHLLSEIAKCFDPLGWLSPVTITTKLLFQQVWLSKIEWNEQLPEDIVKEIKSVVPPNNWNHVKSEQNPADCAVQGLLPSHLNKFPWWWEGPAWLRNKEHSNINPTKQTLTKNKEHKIQTYVVQTPESSIITELIKKKTITNAARTLVVSRFIQCLKTKACGYVTSEPTSQSPTLRLTPKSNILKLDPQSIERHIATFYGGAKPTNDVTKKQKVNQKTMIQYLCLFLSLASLIPGSQQQQQYVNMSPFESGRQIYYDDMGPLQTIHNSWKILTFYNMTTYWQGVNSMDSYVNHVDEICKTFVYQGLCDSIVTELQQEMEDLKHNNYILQNQHMSYRNRTKRGFFNGVGQLAHSLFGVLDESFAEQYQQDIEHVGKNENHLLDLLKNQTSIIEAHNNLLQRNEKSMIKQFKLLEQHIQRAQLRLSEMQDTANQSHMMNYFNAMALSATIIINKLQKIQHSIIDTLNSIHRGHVDSTLISQQQILDQLSIIAAQLPKHLSLPVEDIYHELPEVYKLLHIKARVTDYYLIMEIQLPLTNDDQFRLYKVVPIPIINNSKTVTIVTQFEYIAINILKDIYIQLSEKELKTCVVQQENRYICTFNNPIHNLQQSHVPCEISFLVNNNGSQCTYHTEECTNEWIGLHSYNTWMYVCCGECQVRIICQTHMISRETKGSGLITVGQGCTIKRDHTTIQTDTIYQSKLYVQPRITIPKLSDLNNITKITPPKMIESITNEHTETFKELEEHIQDIKQKSKLPDQLTKHDVHQYTVSYVSLALLLLGGVAGCIYIHLRLRPRSKNAEAQNTVEDATRGLEMASINSGRRAEMTSRPHPRKPIYAVPHKNQFNV